MTKEILYPYALMPKQPGLTSAVLSQAADTDFDLVHVDEPRALASVRFYCAGCRGEMIAKRGAHIRHHFAHRATCACSGGGETLSHLLGKRIISENEGALLRSPAIRGKIALWPSQAFRYEDACLEQIMVRRYRPDAQITIFDERVAIEVLVTHTPEPEKIACFVQAKIPMLEIDCNGLVNMPLAQATEHVLRSGKRRWLVPPRAFSYWQDSVARQRREEADAQKEARRPQELTLLAERMTRLLRAYGVPDDQKPRAILSEAEKRCIKRISAKSVFRYRLEDVFAIVAYEKKRGRSVREVYDVLCRRGMIDPVFDDVVARNALLMTRKLDLSAGAMVEKLFHAR